MPEELSTVLETPMGENNWKLWTPPYVPFVSIDFNLYSLTVINYNCEYNSFSEFCDSFYQIVKPEDDSGLRMIQMIQRMIEDDSEDDPEKIAKMNHRNHAVRSFKEGTHDCR